MSRESVESMMEAASQDETLQQKIASAGSFGEVVQIGSDNGYSFTQEELQIVLAERGISVTGDSESEELSDEALEAVAGGLLDGWNINIRWGGW